MRWKFVVTGALLAAIALVGWAALAQAQPNPPAIPSSTADLKPGELPPPPPGAGLPGLPEAPMVPPPPPSPLVPPTPQPPSVPAVTPPAPVPPPPPVPGELPGVTPPPPGLPEVPTVPPELPGTKPETPPTKPVEPTPAPTPKLTPTPMPMPMPMPPTPPVELPVPVKPEKVPVEVRPGVPTRPEAKTPETPIVVETPIGRQEPAVSLEWGGNGVVKIGQTGEYTLTVKNTSVQPIQSVMARVRMPQGLTLVESTPRHAEEAGMMVWDLGTMTPRQERVLHLKLKADAKGDMMPQAWVTFTGSAAIRLRVREPKLMVKIQSPEKVLVGDATQFTLVISNPGDGSADAVKINAQLSEGLEHARGNKLDFEIGSLAPGESRNVTLLCASRTGGAQKVDVTATADHGLKATDSCPVNVIMPRLDISLVGPRLRYLDRKARYTLKVTNPGDAPATNVTVADIVPAGFKVLAASNGGRWDSQTRMVSWFLGEIAPGASREVEMEVQAITAGSHTHKATAVGARGLRAESELTTKVEGVAAMLVELIDTEDPIEVNGETTYEVRITNTGSKTESDIKLLATVPEEMQFKNADGPVRYREEGKTIVFEPIERLAPRADAIFRIKVKTLKAGSVRFKIQVSSANMSEPVVKMEPTRIYADAPEGEK